MGNVNLLVIFHTASQIGVVLVSCLKNMDVAASWVHQGDHPRIPIIPPAVQVLSDFMNRSAVREGWGSGAGSVVADSGMINLI